MQNKILDWCFKLKDGLKIVESNERLSRAYLEQAKSSLLRAEKNLDDNDLLWSTVAIYYSEYYALYSFLQKIGIKCENHAATIILLKELFGIDNKSISSAKTERIDKQYYTDFVVRNNDVTELISIAESFIGGVDLFVDKITEEEKKHYLKEFKKAYFA